MEKHKPGYNALIPSYVRYDDELPFGARLLFGEISALANAQGFCWASNGYFATLYGVSISTISEWVGMLAERQYIFLEIEKNYKRNIYIADPQILNSFKSLRKIPKGDTEKAEAPPTEKAEENDTSINNRINSEATASNLSFEEFLDTTNTVSDYEGDGEVAQLVFRRDGRAISEKVLRREYEKAHPAPSKRPLNAPRLRDSFDFDTWLMALKDSPKKEDKIVALIWKEKGYRFDNYEQWRAQMGMDGVWAKKLIGYSGQQILDAIEKCRHDSEKGGYEWKSSTVVKKIAETTI